MKLLKQPSLASPQLPHWAIGLGLFLAGAGLCYGAMSLGGWSSKSAAAAQAAAKTEDKETSENPATVRMEESKWEAAGLKIEPAKLAPLTDRIWRTGKIALDRDHVANITPLVEGIVRDMPVRLGQEVEEGAVLALLNSKEVGQTKLDLVRNRLTLTSARINRDWVETIGTNTEELLQGLDKGMPILDIEKRFKGRPIGEWREKLIAAYAHRLLLRKETQELTKLYQEGAVPLVKYRKSQTDYEAAEAAYSALWEEMKFQARQRIRLAVKELREAETAVTLSMALLMMMGFSPAEVAAMDPAAEKDKASIYPIRAPFAGTVIGKFAALSERVGPQAQVFQLADLSNVWVEADVPEADAAFLDGIAGKDLHFRLDVPDAAVWTARVFSAGDLVDKDTRAITLRAVAANAERKLKPGMFVKVELSRGGGAPVVQVPASAIQHHDNQTFVFVHEQKDVFRRVDVTPGRESSGMVEIRAGLQAGQEVVVQGGFALKSEMLRSLLAE